MNTQVAITILLLVGLVTAVHSSSVNNDLNNEDAVVYPRKNYIMKIVVPLNSMTLNEDTDNKYLFYIDAQKGLYVEKNGEVTKLLTNVVDIAATMDNSNKVYLAATDGIYTFKAKDRIAEKYGSLTDNVISIAVTSGTEEIYIITKEKVLYKVTDGGNSKVEIANVKDALGMALDGMNNLYFVDGKKQVFVRSTDGIVTKVKGLPENPTVVKLINGVGSSMSVSLFIDNIMYRVYFNGTCEFANFNSFNMATATSPDSCLIYVDTHTETNTHTHTHTNSNCTCPSPN
ncbi:uncharacterized protein LOC114357437 [Ostrinia furnacalis]|uniref:uncharacterized protein LOC114357437 n=1 Tax=Ostrinia furnacalis TaxID=93504 RepID=UPI001038E1B1|nr:uncharacterized protein LOC114357437 [Ostrinia furnacalis]